MSRIEEALKKLREVDANGTPRKRPPMTSGPKRQSLRGSAKEKVVIHGARHHVDLAGLVADGLVPNSEQENAVADEFRRIKRPIIENALRPSADNPSPNIVMVTSALPNAGKTFCCVNLAISMSLERELNVLLIDGDVAKPHISSAFGLGGNQGLIDLLLGKTERIEDVLVRTDLNDVQVLPAGSHHPQATELLASDRMAKFMSELAERYSDRIIIVDSPPLIGTSEAQALASQVGGVVFVIETGRTELQTLLHAVEMLPENIPVNAILNKSRSSSPASYYGLDYGYYGSAFPR